LVTRNDTYQYKNWCNEPLEKLKKNGDNFCTTHPGFLINAKKEEKPFSLFLDARGTPYQRLYNYKTKKYANMK